MLRFVFASISRSVGICYHQIELISWRTMIVKLRWLSININSAANWVNSPAPFPLTHTHTCTTINYETKRYCHLAASRCDRATFNVPYIYIWPAVAALGRSQKQPQSTLTSPSPSLLPLQLQRRTCCRLSCCLVTR